MDKLDQYCTSHTDPEPPILAEINRETHLTQLKPRMLSGHFQGRLLSFISKLIQPTNILEIGTFTGYSAICLAEGLKPSGKLITIEANEELEHIILKNIEKSQKKQEIQLIIGNALQVIPQLDIIFDLVFIDADKLNYINYYDLCINKLRKGGLLITDNVLWSGKVLDESAKDSTTQVLRKYNHYLASDQRTEKVLLPIRDGLYLSRKI